jgi:hypothetical protein
MPTSAAKGANNAKKKGQFGAINSTFMSQFGTGFTHFPPPLFPHNHTFS